MFGKILKRKPITKVGMNFLSVKENIKYLDILDQRLTFSKYKYTSLELTPLEKPKTRFNEI